MKLEFSRLIFEKYSNFMKIRPLGTKLPHARRRTARLKDWNDEANSRFSAILRTRLKKTIQSRMADRPSGTNADTHVPRSR